MHPVSCTNTHRDVTDLVNHVMVKNTKAWIPWEWNIIFIRNKKNFNLYLRWHILRSYRFIAEVTLKDVSSLISCTWLTKLKFTVILKFYYTLVERGPVSLLPYLTQPAFTCSRLIIVNFEHIPHLVLVFLLLTLNM